MKSKVAEIVILLGSQKGKTESFARLLKDSLLRTGQKVVLHSLNDYASFPKMKQLIVLTSTYGKGVPPNNAKNFLTLLQKIENPSNVKFSVVGFGSRKYPKFCQFAKDVQEALLKHSSFKQTIKPVYIDKSCSSTFLNWSDSWSAETGIRLQLNQLQKTPKLKSYRFKVKHYYQSAGNSSKNIFIELATKKHKKIKQGDLIVIGSKEQHYPIKKLNNKNVLISLSQSEIKSVAKYFGKLKKKKKFKARHICNTHFQLLGEGMNYADKKISVPDASAYPKLLKKLG